MKRLGAIILTFYFGVFIYILIVKPIVILWCIVSLFIALLLSKLIQDIIIPKLIKK